MNATRRKFLLGLAAAGFAKAEDKPKRNMIVRSTRPEDLEMPLDGFLDYITPNDRFYVRSHHYTPKVDLGTWRLKVGGTVAQELTLTMDELRKLPRVELVGVMECAGNGRGFYEPTIAGLQWENGSVGNAKWAGARLSDVLKRAGVKAESKHVLFDGADVPVGKQPEFRRTVPIQKAMSPETLLCYEMNGEALPVSHGFPLRVVVPGWAGDSWVKWITSIEALDKEYDGFFMKVGYRHPGRPVTPGVAVDPAKMHPVESVRIKSVIASPHHTAAPGTAIRGVAWSGEVPLAAVDVSVDAGRTWKPARFTSARTRYGWATWEIQPNLTEGHYIVMSRARDIKGGTQPFAQEWNPSGYLWNVVPQVRIDVGVKPVPPPPATAAGIGPGVPDHFNTSCSPCHEDNVVRQQRMSKAQWDREVTKMQGWGAQVKPENREELLEYLTSQFGPRRR